MILRILAFFVLIFSVLFMPFWTTVLLGLACLVYFNFFFEVIIIFFLSDLFYGTRTVKFFDMVFVSTTVSILIFVAIELIKKKVKFYK